MMQNQSVMMIIAATCLFSLVACGGGGGGGGSQPGTMTGPTPAPDPTATPAHHLGTARFTTHQPKVLEQIGAHHAYARGLTGRGVRIGIDDTIVDYTQSGEFGNRMRLTEADGASLAYARPDGDQSFSDVETCILFDPSCSTWEGNSGGDPEAVNSWVRQIVETNGWPTSDDSVFIVDEYYDENNPIERLFRWSEVPTPYGTQGSHGTAVASVAAGQNLGVAPGATIIPIAQNLSDDQSANALADEIVQRAVAALPSTTRSVFDNELASAQRDNYAKFDIINRSYGTSLFDPEVISSSLDSELQWYRQYLPRTLDAILQTDRPDAEKTIIVYAAGNDGEPWSGVEADLPYYIPELRGHSLSVASTDPETGGIADYSNRCGPLPSDWNTARHGPHYCLSAPGTVRGLMPNPNSPGRGNVSETQGTSLAAPVVSGALALLMEHFRGTRGNTEVVKRMLDTADRTGRYADSETYGAGHLDLEAALAPVGTLNAGQSAQALHLSSLQTPVAFGSVASRVAGLELAAFDEQDFPFWVPLSSTIFTRLPWRSSIPEFQRIGSNFAPATGLDTLGLQWTSLSDTREVVGQPDGQEWVAGFGQGSVSFARRPQHGGWGYGFSFNNGNYLGARTTGAFGTNLRSGMVWSSHAVEHDLGNGWKLDATGTLAISLPDYENNAIFEASSSVLSALSIRVGTQNTGFTVQQPLRAETGVGTFRIENGQIENGRRLYDKYRVRLSPNTREIRLMVHHEREAAGGKVAVEAGGTMNVGHVPGRHDSRLGFIYRLIW